MAEFEVNGRNYMSGRMDAMTQFNIIRKLSPILEPLGQYIKLNIEKVKNPQQPESASDTLLSSMPIIQAISDLPEDSVDFIISTCMALVRRDEGQGRGWAPIWNIQAHRPQFEDIDMVTMLMIVVQVLGGSFQPFLQGSGWSSNLQPNNSSTSIQ